MLSPDDSLEYGNLIHNRCFGCFYFCSFFADDPEQIKRIRSDFPEYPRSVTKNPRNRPFNGAGRRISDVVGKVTLIPRQFFLVCSPGMYLLKGEMSPRSEWGRRKDRFVGTKFDFSTLKGGAQITRHSNIGSGRRRRLLLLRIPNDVKEK